jgi:hypothetical protein
LAIALPLAYNLYKNVILELIFIFLDNDLIFSPSVNGRIIVSLSYFISNLLNNFSKQITSKKYFLYESMSIANNSIQCVQKKKYDYV